MLSDQLTLATAGWLVQLKTVLYDFQPSGVKFWMQTQQKIFWIKLYRFCSMLPTFFVDFAFCYQPKVINTFLFIHLILTFVLKTQYKGCLLYTLLIFSNLVFFFFFKIFWMKTFRKLVKLLSHVWLFSTPCIVAYQVPPSMGFSRQEYWSGLPFPSPGDLSDPGIKPGSPAL